MTTTKDDGLPKINLNNDILRKGNAPLIKAVVGIEDEKVDRELGVVSDTYDNVLEEEYDGIDPMFNPYIKNSLNKINEERVGLINGILENPLNHDNNQHGINKFISNVATVKQIKDYATEGSNQIKALEKEINEKVPEQYRVNYLINLLDDAQNIINSGNPNDWIALDKNLRTRTIKGKNGESYNYTIVQKTLPEYFKIYVDDYRADNSFSRTYDSDGKRTKIGYSGDATVFNRDGSINKKATDDANKELMEGFKRTHKDIIATASFLGIDTHIPNIPGKTSIEITPPPQGSVGARVGTFLEKFSPEVPTTPNISSNQSNYVPIKIHPPLSIDKFTEDLKDYITIKDGSPNDGSKGYLKTEDGSSNSDGKQMFFDVGSFLRDSLKSYKDAETEEDKQKILNDINRLKDFGIEIPDGTVIGRTPVTPNEVSSMPQEQQELVMGKTQGKTVAEDTTPVRLLHIETPLNQNIKVVEDETKIKDFVKASREFYKKNHGNVTIEGIRKFFGEYFETIYKKLDPSEIKDGEKRLSVKTIKTRKIQDLGRDVYVFNQGKITKKFANREIVTIRVSTKKNTNTPLSQNLDKIFYAYFGGVDYVDFNVTIENQSNTN